MTYAPASLTALGAYWTSQGGANLGIVGNAAHTYGYHLGRDRIYGAGGQGDADYSVKLPQDRAGLTDAAAAIDLGAGSLNLRDFTAWLLAECLGRAPGTELIREVIGSTDGTTVVGWTITAPGQLVPGYGDSSHLWHTHVSFLRSTEYQEKTSLFARYFQGGSDMALALTYPDATYGSATTTGACSGIRLDTGEAVASDGGQTYPVICTAEIAGLANRSFVCIANSAAGMYGGAYVLAFSQNDVTYAPIPAPAPPATITLGPGLYEVK